MASDAVTIILPDNPSPELLERLRDNFPDSLVHPPGGDAADPLLAAEEIVADAVAASGRLPEALESWWAGLSGGGFGTLALVAAIFLLARLIEGAALSRLGPASPSADLAPGNFSDRCRRALGWGLWRLAGLAAFTLAAFLLARLSGGVDPAAPSVARALVAPVLWFRVFLAIVDGLVAPGHPPRRLMGLRDDEAASVLRASRVFAWAVLVVAASRALLFEAAGLAPESQAPRAALVAIQAAITALYFLRIGRPIGALAVRAATEAEGAPGWLAWIAPRWAWAYAAMAVADGVLKAMGAFGMLTGAATSGAGPALLVLSLAPLAVIGLGLWRAELAASGRRSLLPAVFSLAEGLIIVGAAVLLLRIWNVDPFRREGVTGLARLLPALVEAGVIAVAGIAVWRAVAAILRTPPRPGPGEVVDEETVRRTTRLETILPLLRGFALAAIALLTGMTALAAMGVDIAPLLASAGVIGLAIGFGAQRLVSDVISGMFSLYEDAFRLGEYIETKSGKGVVDRISLRSVRLRHHRGPLFTIPFSEMGTIQNHSRDWVKMKFTFSIPGDEDVEMVRKLVKKVGEALLTDPELEGKFIEPLKSQGAVAIVANSYEIACKFVCKPGQQFMIRRKAIAALQKVFAEKGIHLFTPQMTLTPGEPSRPRRRPDPEPAAARLAADAASA
jgi:small-conductance mechanosensitive channel